MINVTLTSTSRKEPNPEHAEARRLCSVNGGESLSILRDWELNLWLRRNSSLTLT